MSHKFTGQISHYSGLPEFQEAAVKKLNELFGRQRPLDVFDFSVDHKNGTFEAIGYYEEHAPKAKKIGEPVEEVQTITDENGFPIEGEEDDEKIEKPIEEISKPVEVPVEENINPADISTEPVDRSAELPVEQDAVEPIVQCTNAAIVLAQKSDIDIRKVIGTGVDGKIGKPDVEKYIKGLAE